MTQYRKLTEFLSVFSLKPKSQFIGFFIFSSVFTDHRPLFPSLLRFLVQCFSFIFFLLIFSENIYYTQKWLKRIFKRNRLNIPEKRRYFQFYEKIIIKLIETRYMVHHRYRYYKKYSFGSFQKKLRILSQQNRFIYVI